MMHRSILCLGALFCTITPRNVTNTSFCAVIHGIIYSLSIARWRTLWFSQFDPSHPTAQTTCILLGVYYTHSLSIFRISDWPHALNSAYRIEPVLPVHTLQLLPSCYFVTQNMEAESSPETSAFIYVMFNDVSTHNLIVLWKVADFHPFITE
jgi:hypothetical protein